MSNRIRCISKWAVALSVGTVLVAAPTGSAHVEAIVASCEAGVVINLTDYDGGGINTISVSIDGAVAMSTSFGAGISTAVPFGDPFATHSYRVVVRAWDDPDSVIGWSFDTGVLGIPVCAELPPATTAAPTTTTVPPVTATTLVAGGTVTTSTVAPTPSTAPTPSSTAPSAVPPSTAGVVAQAPGGPTTVPAAVPPVAPPTTAPPTTVIVASEAPPVVDAELPATGDVNFVVVALGLIVGGIGLLTTALLRRPTQS